MRLTNSDTEYGLVTKALHWSIAVLVAFQFAGGVAGIGDEVHATAGLLVLVLVTLRLLWRLLVALPDWAPVLTGFERRLVHRYEQLLYAMLFAKPITGLFLLNADEGEIELLGDVKLPALISESDRYEDLFGPLHFWSGVVLLVALALHIGLVLRHQLLLRDGLAYRMLWWR
jgi:cytochrome b561